MYFRGKYVQIKKHLFFRGAPGMFFNMDIISQQVQMLK